MMPAGTLAIGRSSQSQAEVIGRRTSSGGAVFIIDVGPRRDGERGDAQELGRAGGRQGSRPAMLALRPSQ